MHTTPPSILSVDASAGSGKTYALAQYYIQLLMNESWKKSDIPLKSILAITFTNKAAREMKERIIGLLSRLALGQFTSPEEQKQWLSLFTQTPREVETHAMQVLEYVLRHYDFFQVQTIDSFMKDILTGSLFRLARTAHATIAHDHRRFIEYSVDTVIEEASHDEGLMTLFNEFLDHYFYIQGNAPWLPKKDIIEAMEHLFSVTGIYGVPCRASEVAEYDIGSIKGKVRSILEIIANNKPEGTDKRFLSVLERIRDKKTITVEDFNKKSFTDKEHFPVTKHASIPDNIAHLWKELRTLITSWCNEEAVSLFNPYIRLYERFYEHLERAAKKEDVLFLAELKASVYRLISRGALSVPEMYCRLAAKIEHYVIDEFQDTSLLQWRNLEPLVREALSAQGSLFYVGDKKQSIYRFNGAEYRLFDEIMNRFPHHRFEKRTLAMNRRSERAIVETVNMLFSKGNLEAWCGSLMKDDEEDLFDRDVVDRILESFTNSAQSVAKGHDRGYVRIEVLEEEESDTIVEKTIQVLTDVHARGFLYRECAVLVRSNKEVEEWTQELIAADIPAVSDKTLTIRNHIHINELMCFLRFLDSPIDDFSFASWIVSDVFLNATALGRERMEEFIFTYHHTSAHVPYLYMAFREAFPEIWEQFIETAFFKKVGIIPLYEFVRHIAEVFQVFRVFPTETAFFMRLLELVEEVEQECASIANFLLLYDSMAETDERLYVKRSDSYDAVRIVTYHKAKGLEFPVVIIPHMAMAAKVDKEVVYTAHEKEETIRIMHVLKAYTPWSSALRTAYYHELANAYSDELHVLYVALTRAQYELYVFVPYRSEGHRHNHCRALIPEHPYECGKPSDRKTYTPKGNVSPHPECVLPVSRYIPWMNVLSEKYISRDELIHRKRILEGTILHYFLSCINNLAGDDIRASVEHACDMVSLAYPHLENISDYAARIERLITNPCWKNLFYVPKGEVFTEKDIATKSGEIKRIDRLIITPDEVRIVDYKLVRHTHDMSYNEQVRMYARLLQELYPDKRVSGYLLYLETTEGEEVAL